MHRAFMRSVVLAASTALVAGIATGCGSPAGKDPYQLVTDSAAVNWDPIQINVNLSASVAGQTLALDRSNIAVVIDRAAGKGAFHMSIPARDLGADASLLRAAGLDGDSLDFDGLYDGKAVYGRGNLLILSLQGMLAPTQHLSAGDAAGWLKLGTAEEWAAFSNLAARAAPSMAAPSNIPSSVRETLDSLGVALTLAGTERHDNADAWHLTATVDPEKLFSSPMMSTANQVQLQQAKVALQAVTVSAELWIDVATSRATELDIRVADKGNTSQAGTIRIFARDPDGSVRLDAPASSTTVPLTKMLQDMMRLMSGGATS